MNRAGIPDDHVISSARARDESGAAKSIWSVRNLGSPSARIRAREQRAACPGRDEGAVRKGDVVQVISRGGRLSPSNEVWAREYVSAVAHRHIYRGTGHTPERYAVHTATRNGVRRQYPGVAVGTGQDRAVGPERNELGAHRHSRADSPTEPPLTPPNRSPRS